MRRAAIGVGLLLTLGLGARAVAAQRSDEVRAGVGRVRPPSYAPIASAIIPGAGQFLEKKNRAVIYAAVEALSWWKYSRDARERQSAFAAYKDLARQSARAHLSPGGPDGDWTYYEMMRDFLESGQYSKSDSRLVPEDDPATFNGNQWILALATSPDSAAALVRYQQRAYKPDMLWSWRNAQLQYDLFKRATEKRNDANAAAQLDLSVIALNHLLSMIDALATFRLVAWQQANGSTAVGASLKW